MKHLFTILCLLLVFCSACALVAAPAFFEVPPNETMQRDINLTNDDKVSGRVILVGNPLSFTICDPDGLVLQNYTISGQADFEFTALKTGTYSLFFTNNFSDSATHVTLNYNAQRFIFGFPQEFIILFIIVGLALVAVIVFVAMSPKP
jgi:hypothetical protein